jgi:hypothetical protein
MRKETFIATHVHRGCRAILQSPVRYLTLLLMVGLLCAPLPAAKKKETAVNSQDPYATAEHETLAPVSVDDLAYRAIVFQDFVVPAEWEEKARKLVNETEERAIGRLISRQGFTTIARKQNPLPAGPFLDVKCTLLQYRMVSTTLRIFAGAAGGTSYITYKVEVMDGKSGSPLFQRVISTENNAFAAAFSFNDIHLPEFLGNVLGDYLALRARKDKGESVVTLDADASSLKTK